jgi:predicted phosphodiesterase
MMQTMVSQGCKFGVTSGDLAWSGYEYSWIEASFTKRIQRYLGSSIPFYVAWGNHDGNQWALARNFISQPPSNSNYSFNYAGCHFTCIDAADFNNFTWIANDLQAAQGSKFIFVFCHYPPYCERWYAGEAQYQAQLAPLLEQYNVNICFSGHTHEYERGLQGGVYYVITGGGSWLDYTEPLVYDWPHMTKGGYNDLDGSIDGGLINEFVRVNVTGSTLTCTLVAFNTDGTIYSQTLDTFNATPPPPLFSDGFESGNFTTGGWTRQNTNATVSTAAKYTGTYGSKLAGTTWIQKAISTAGKTNVHVKYKRKTAGMDSGENLYVEWSVNGTNWYNLETTRSTSWATQDKTCASGANNNANFRVRFRTNASAASSEYAYIDDVVITGQ